ncbi:hypothetical protein Aple_069950 [Acrocarpospora pleiomorpha]|uniref:Uncharacterized protein n=1 Tax=Acrocarpospora pleiomorpha TaxID=90975 RepID=A0A5M3XTC3_9ACTN|nr:hypothetical protein [Acrocarpospora pleiomorpha]GES24096.1 hypothetical protein Aple_069950 [Acrocarpospora pleiomorpha]
MTRERAAAAVFRRLLGTAAVNRKVRWDLASPYLRRHAAEHAADADQLGQLLRDPEFLVYGDPMSILSYDLKLTRQREREPEEGVLDLKRIFDVYRASLPRHLTAHPEARRQILAVDAIRYREGDLSAMLANPRTVRVLPWQCEWSTSGNVSRALRTTLTGHERAVRMVATGRLIAITGGDDPVVRVWGLRGGLLLRELGGHAGAVTALAYLPGHEIAITADAAGVVRCWDLRHGDLLQALPTHNGPVTGLAVAGPLVVTCGQDGTAWMSARLGTGKRQIAAEPGPLGPLVLTHDGMTALIGSASGEVLVVELATGRLVERRRVGEAAVTVLASVFRDGRIVVVAGGADGAGLVWGLLDGKVIAELRGRAGDMAVMTVLEDDPDLLAAIGGEDGAIRVWDLSAGAVRKTLLGHHAAITGLARYSPSLSARLSHVLGSPNLYIASSRSAVEETLREETRSTDSRMLLSASADGTLRGWYVWDVQARQVYAAHTGPVRAVAALNHDGSPMAVSGGEDATVRMWELDGPRVADTRVSHPQPIVSVVTQRLAHESVIITACGDDRMRLFSLATEWGVGGYATGGGTATTLCPASSPEGPLILTAAADGTLTARLTATGHRIWRGDEGPGPIVALEAGGSSRRPVAVALDAAGRVRLTAITTGRPVACPAVDELLVSAIAVGRVRERPLLFLGGRDGCAVLDLISGRIRRWISRGQGIVRLAYGHGPDVHFLAATNADGKIRIWDADTGRLLQTINGDFADVSLMRFSEADHPLLGVVSDNAVKLWKFPDVEGPTTLYLPDTVRSISFAEDRLVIGYGRELAVFAPEKPSPRTPSRQVAATTPADERPATIRGPKPSPIALLLLGAMASDALTFHQLIGVLCPCIPLLKVRDSLAELHQLRLIKSADRGVDHSYRLTREGSRLVDRLAENPAHFVYQCPTGRHVPRDAPEDPTPDRTPKKKKPRRPISSKRRTWNQGRRI